MAVAVWMPQVAGVSSFIFQLPIMLCCFEVDAWRREARAVLPQQQQRQDAQEPRPPSPSARPGESKGDLGPAGSGADGSAPVPVPLAGAAARNEAVDVVEAERPIRRWAGVGRMGSWRMSRAQASRLGRRLLSNHVLWGVGIGLVLSLSKLGPKYLNPGQ